MLSRARRLVEELSPKGDINIHIHLNKHGLPPATPEESPPTVAGDEIVAPGNCPPMPFQPDLTSGGAKNYVFKVKRDAQGRITEIAATKLP